MPLAQAGLVDPVAPQTAALKSTALKVGAKRRCPRLAQRTAELCQLHPKKGEQSKRRLQTDSSYSVEESTQSSVAKPETAQRKRSAKRESKATTSKPAKSVTAATKSNPKIRVARPKSKQHPAGTDGHKLKRRTCGSHKNQTENPLHPSGEPCQKQIIFSEAPRQDQRNFVALGEKCLRSEEYRADGAHSSNVYGGSFQTVPVKTKYAQTLWVVNKEDNLPHQVQRGQDNLDLQTDQGLKKVTLDNEAVRIDSATTTSETIPGGTSLNRAASDASQMDLSSASFHRQFSKIRDYENYRQLLQAQANQAAHGGPGDHEPQCIFPLVNVQHHEMDLQRFEAALQNIEFPSNPAADYHRLVSGGALLAQQAAGEDQFSETENLIYDPYSDEDDESELGNLAHLQSYGEIDYDYNLFNRNSGNQHQQFGGSCHLERDAQQTQSSGDERSCRQGTPKVPIRIVYPSEAFKKEQNEAVALQTSLQAESQEHVQLIHILKQVDPHFLHWIKFTQSRKQEVKSKLWGDKVWNSLAAKIRSK